MSWEQLLSIYREAQALRVEDKTEPPVACPNDGEPLQAGPDGKLFCKYDGWQPDGMGR